MVGEVVVAVEAALPQRPGAGQGELSCTLEVLGESRGESVSEQLQGVVGPRCPRRQRDDCSAVATVDSAPQHRPLLLGVHGS